MTKVSFGDYSAFETKGTIRYQQNNRLVSESVIPAEVASFLRYKMQEETQAAKPEPEATPIPVQTEPETPEITALDLDTLVAMREQASRELDAMTVKPLNPADFDTPAPTEPVLMGYAGDEGKDEGKAEPLAEPTVDYNYMESVSIHTASLEDIARAMYDRFGVYTVYLNEFPKLDEINPLAGVPFSKYYHGIAYQSLIAARSTGVFQRPAELAREQMVEGRLAHEQVDQSFGGGRQDSFEYRTSPAAQKTTPESDIVHVTDPVTGEVRAERSNFDPSIQHDGRVNNSRQRFDATEDEVLVEPKFGEQVIRPNW